MQTDERGEIKTLTIENGAAVSSTFFLPRWDAFVGILLPDIDAGPVGMEVSFDGSNFFPVLDIVDGDDIIICANGADPGWIDVSDVLKALPPKALIRLTTAVQSALRTIYVSFRY